MFNETNVWIKYGSIDSMWVNDKGPSTKTAWNTWYNVNLTNLNKRSFYIYKSRAFLMTYKQFKNNSTTWLYVSYLWFIDSYKILKLIVGIEIDFRLRIGFGCKVIYDHCFNCFVSCKSTKGFNFFSFMV